MSVSGDYEDEMFRRSHLDDETIDRLLTGQAVPGEESLVSFVDDVHLAATVPGTIPMSNPALAAMFAEGFSTEKGDLLVTAGSNVTGPAPQAAGLPKWRKKNMIELALSKLAALGLAAKLGVAAGAVALTGTAAAAAGVLPDVAQDPVADAVDAIVDIPGGKSADVRQDADHRQDGDVGSDDGETELPAEADFGANVSQKATGGAPQEDGRQFGEDVSTDARESFQPEGTPTADDNPGTEFREDAGTQQPEGTPTADDNPGSSLRP